MQETLKSWIYRFAPLWYMISSVLVGTVLLVLGNWVPAEWINLVLEFAGGVDVVRQILAALLAAFFAGSMGLAVNQNVQIKAAQRDAGVEPDAYIGPVTRAAWRSGGMSGGSGQGPVAGGQSGEQSQSQSPGGAARMPRPEPKAIAKQKPTPKGPFNGRARP
jgi:hypothetical protein